MKPLDIIGFLGSVLLLGAVLVVLCVFSCTHTISVTGGTGAGNPAVLCFVTDSTGAIVRNAVVKLRRADYLTNITQVLPKRMVSISDTLTDDYGCFRFDSVDTGYYCIEVNAGDTLAAMIRYRAVIGDTSTDTLFAIVRAFATITGTVMYFGGPTTQAFITAYGLDRVAKVTQEGNFAIRIPEGTYILRLIPVQTTYNAFDIPSPITISAGSTISIGTIAVLPLEPTCQGWECDSVIVRVILDSNGLTTTPVASVSYRDSTGRLFHLRLNDLPITKLPNVIGGLSALTNFECERTKLVEISPQIGRLTQLTTLEINDNELTNLPIEITGLNNLTTLDVHNNRLANLPAVVVAWLDKMQPGWQDMQRP